MSEYKRKTIDTWQIHVNYGQGFEHEITEFSFKEAKQRIKEYRLNCPEFPVRSVYRKERKNNNGT